MHGTKANDLMSAGKEGFLCLCTFQDVCIVLFAEETMDGSVPKRHGFAFTTILEGVVSESIGRNLRKRYGSSCISGLQHVATGSCGCLFVAPGGKRTALRCSALTEAP